MAVFTSIGAAIFGAGTFLAGVTAAGLQIAAGVAVSLIGKAMQGEPQAPRFGVQGQVQTGDDVPRSILFGWSCTAGSKVYQNEWGSGGTMSTRVLALADYPIRELRQVIVDGSPVTLLTGQAHPQYGWPVQEYRKGGKDHLWIKFYDGTQTAADSFLVNSVSSSQRPYSSARVGRGIPYVIATSRAPERTDDGEKPLFQGFPQFKFATYGARLYDPSRDSSVGGSGTQRWDNPATWGGDGDFLPPVQIYNLLRGIRFSGQWLYGLQNVNAARVPVANWIAAINRARVTLTTPDGNEPTFRAGGEVQVGAPVHLAIEAFVTACNGQLAETGGTYKLHVGEPGAPVMAFDDGDIISTEEQSFTPFYSLADTVNGVSASYPNPAEGWNTKTAPKLLRPDLETLDGNRRLLASLSFDMVPYTWQVQRLMAWALAEALRARRHTFVLGPEFRVLEPSDVVRWTSERNHYVDKLFRVDGLVYKSNLDVIVDLTEVDPSDYDPDITYRPIYDGPLQLVGPQPMPMQGWQVLPAIIRDQEGNQRRPSIEVRYASGLSDVERVRVRVRVVGETGIIFDGEVPYADPWAVVLAGQFSPATDYEVQGIFVRESGSPAEWSAWLAVTTPDIKLGPLDLDIDQIADEVGQAVGERFDWTVHNTRETIERLREAFLEDGAGSANAYLDRQRVRMELTAVAGQIRADYTLDILAAVGPNSAIVARIEELRAEVFDPTTGLPATAAAVNVLSSEVDVIDGRLTATSNAITSLVSSVPGASAEGLLRIYTSAAATGEEVRIALSAATSGSAGPANAAMFLTAGGGNSEILLVANRIAFITSPTGTKRGLLVVDGDNVYIDNARIRNLGAGQIDVDSIFAANANITGTLRLGPGTSGPGLYLQGTNSRILIVDGT